MQHVSSSLLLPIDRSMGSPPWKTGFPTALPLALEPVLPFSLRRGRRSSCRIEFERMNDHD